LFTIFPPKFKKKAKEGITFSIRAPIHSDEGVAVTRSKRTLEYIIVTRKREREREREREGAKIAAEPARVDSRDETYLQRLYIE